MWSYEVWHRESASHWFDWSGRRRNSTSCAKRKCRFRLLHVVRITGTVQFSVQGRWSPQSKTMTSSGEIMHPRTLPQASQLSLLHFYHSSGFSHRLLLMLNNNLTRFSKLKLKNIYCYWSCYLFTLHTQFVSPSLLDDANLKKTELLA